MAPRHTLTEIFPSRDEMVAGRLNDTNVRLLLEGLHSDGIVLLRDIINVDHLDALNVHMTREATAGVEAGVRLNQGAENLQQAPPLVPEDIFFDDIYLNKIICHAVTLYLGDGAKWDLVTGNTALPRSSKRQPVHSDANFEHPRCPFYCVANIPLITSDITTGATEIWLGGQHRGNTEDQVPGELSIRPELVESRRAIQPGTQPTVPKGSVILRDLRLWHAGMPNPSDQWRCMVALGFSAPWYHCTNYFKVPVETGIAARIELGLEGTGIVANFQEVSQQQYDKSRYALDFTFKEGDGGLAESSLENQPQEIKTNGVGNTTNLPIAAH